MPPRPEPLREIAVPVSIFASLRHAMAEEVGELPAIHALHNAGFAAGVAAAEAFRSGSGEDLLQLPDGDFWARVTGFFTRRGWGTLTHQPMHQAVGTLASADWSESVDAEGSDASCSFSTGFLSGFLSTLAGGDVAVLEVGCRGRGDDLCTFAFGNASAIHELYGKLLEGTDLPGALAAL